MVAILDMPEVRSRAVPLSVAAYEWMTARGLVAAQTELIHGIIVRKMRKSPLHAQLTDRLFKLMFGAVGERAWVRSEAPVLLNDSVPEPDVSVVAGRDSDYGTQHPRGAKLVIEVAISSDALDREMAQAYAAGGVEEYWLVLAKSKTVECFSDPQEGVYRQERRFGARDAVDSLALPGVLIELKRVFQ